MDVKEVEHIVEPDQSWKIDFFRPEDAHGVVRLFRTVYGDEYPVKTFIDPMRITEENAAKRTISSVVRTVKGDIVGHNALFRSAPFDRIYEAGAGLVLPSYRGGFAGYRVVEHNVKVAPKKFDIEAVFGESVCNHIRMQKISAKLGWTTCAVEIDLMPAETYAQEKSASGRVSTLLDFLVFKPKEQDVHLPARYEQMLRFIYDGLDHGFRLVPSSESLPVELKTRIHTQIYDFAQVARFAVHEAGGDFVSAFDREERAAGEKGTVVYQAWLKLSWPWVGHAVELLRSRGYFIGGALPRWFDVDGLLMQKIPDSPSWDAIQIHSDRARKILEMVREDWAGHPV